MEVIHYPPRRRKTNPSRGLGLCFLATLVFMLILVLVTLAFGQEAHPFPFKTLQEIETGTSTWNLEGTGPPSYCPNSLAQIVKREYYSGARSRWTVYTDGTVFAAGYFTPGEAVPIIIVRGHLTSEGHVVVDSYKTFDGSQRPCDPWTLKGA